MSRASFSDGSHETAVSSLPAPESPKLDNQENNESVPEGGYGWVCVIASSLISAHTWGINSAYGVILAHYLSDDSFPGTSALEYAFVGGLSTGCAMLVSPIVTIIVHHHGIHIALYTGAVLQSLSHGFLLVGSVGVVSHWFHKRRSLVNGITAAGAGLGGLVYSLAAGSMLINLGFAWTMRILGIVSFVVNLISGTLLRIPPSTKTDGNTFAFGLSALRDIRFILLLIWGILSVLAYVALLFSLSSYSVAVGLTQSQASVVSAILNLGQAFGRPVVGIMSDSLGRVNVASGATLVAGVLCLVFWVFAKTMATICVFAIMVGTVSGTIWAAAAPLTVEIVGLRHASSALGLFWLSLGPPTIVAEVIAVQLRNQATYTFPYLRVQMWVGALYISSAVFLFFGKIFDRVRGKIELEKPRAV
uniref:Major facilitator superfamily (MFS) profile domain-containing protein n=1 Tax=Bionectria ochroleuca TaxID=29856 RepID=A0A8H7K981_BIOOC